jgi:thioredoxin-dependent peroxiredoxin
MQAGDKAPEFSLDDQDGVTRTLTSLLGEGPVVLFFYPAAMTSGCTKESCHFRDLKAEFSKVGAQRVGISMDTVDKQRRFSDKHSFDFPLLADIGGSVARAYGVKRPLNLLKVRRSTFVIGTDGIIKAVISSETNMDSHADRALESLSS